MPLWSNIDDLGYSDSVNDAVVKAYRAGAAQSASLMMGERRTEKAVQIARENPSLAVGLHLVLVDGKSVLPAAAIPDLVDKERNFPSNPAVTWLKYFYSQALRPQIAMEIQAQFDAFQATGLALSHVDGHHHQHLHPRVFPLVLKLARERGARWIRATREPLAAWWRASPKRSLAKIGHGLVYHGLTVGMRRRLEREGFFTFDGVFGLLETFSISRDYLLRLSRMNLPGNYELFSHAGADWNRDLEALTDPEVLRALEACGTLSPSVNAGVKKRGIP